MHRVRRQNLFTEIKFVHHSKATINKDTIPHFGANCCACYGIHPVGVMGSETLTAQYIHVKKKETNK